MAKSMTPDGQMDVSDPLTLRGTTQPMPALAEHDEPATSSGRWPVQVRQPSYHPTGWALADRALDFADELSGGRADWIQRAISYLFVGGFAALVNLAVFALMYKVVPLPFNNRSTVQHYAHYLVAFLVATEISILANFIPNDYYTFRHLPGHKRSWSARCLRFHVTCTGGVLVTLFFSFTFHAFGLDAIVSQACALIIATAFNFTFHHLFTYRHTPAAG